MSRIIFIETSTSLCSTALSEGDRIVCSRRSAEPRAHASMTAVYVKEMLDECGWRVQDCDAVCVSKGPGSYTGLRVGASTAKGLCFGGGIPLLSVGTLDTLAWQSLALGEPVTVPGTTVIPMIDARRMEVYAEPFKFTDDQGFVRLGEVKPIVVDAGSFADELAAGPVIFIGDGVDKCRPAITAAAEEKGIAAPIFVQQCPEASSMLRPALGLLEKRAFEDVAYFEPFYLKEFVATVGKRLF
ncbi:MAG: tRNA (adenosine(37)-N6)-threonylcarbamoyltransferase complex dimerization subunit type 1 TsaB [Bacteroidales bacterium]|nr:tRNA (adenosine(37)-N6)-threonylcarbamoyltransferase complex dimerization subunit type 1 TsaB [Bacteroidales bacterium]